MKLVNEDRGDTATTKKFQSLVGSLLLFSLCIRPYISYAVHRVSRRTHSPTLGDFKLAKRVARYLQGTNTVRLILKDEIQRCDKIKIVGYRDADFAADRTDRKSITGGWIKVDGMPVSCMVKKKSGVSLSTKEGEFKATSAVVMQIFGIHELLHEIGLSAKNQ